MLGLWLARADGPRGQTQDGAPARNDGSGGPVRVATRPPRPVEDVIVTEFVLRNRLSPRTSRSLKAFDEKVGQGPNLG
jgi:hypothetical protein